MSWTYRILAALIAWVLVENQIEATPKMLLVIGGLLLLGEIAAWREAWVERAK